MPDTSQVICFDCGIEFAIPGPLYRTCRNNNRSLTCPNGHKFTFAYVKLLDKHDKKVVGLLCEIDRAQRASLESHTRWKAARSLASRYRNENRRLRQQIKGTNA